MTSCDWQTGLRDYQVRMVREVVAASKTGVKTVGLFSATGTGKTRTMWALACRWHAAGARVMVLEDRIEMCEQTAAEFGALGLLCWVLQGSKGSWAEGVMVASVQTLTRRREAVLQWLGEKPLLVLVDEHHDVGWCAGAGWLREVVLGRERSILLAVTATPYRLDPKQGYDQQVQLMVTGMVTAEAQAAGWLVHDRYVEFGGSLEGVRRVAGEFAEDGLEAALGTPEGIQAALEAWQRHGEGRMTLGFAVSVRHAQALSAAFGGAAIWGDMPMPERRQVLEEWKQGKYRALFNVGIAIKGLDVPAIGCVMVCTATESRARWLQMVGRGLRLAAGKTDCIVLDQGGNVGRHGRSRDMVAYCLTRSRDPKDGKKPGKGEPVARECDHCGAEVGPGQRSCPACGNWVPPKLEQITRWPESLDVRVKRLGRGQVIVGDWAEREYRVVTRGETLQRVPAVMHGGKHRRGGSVWNSGVIRHPCGAQWRVGWRGSEVKGAGWVSGELQRVGLGGTWHLVGVQWEGKDGIEQANG